MKICEKCVSKYADDRLACPSCEQAPKVDAPKPVQVVKVDKKSKKK